MVALIVSLSVLQEFSVANADPAGFFPVTLAFSSSTLMSGVTIKDIVAVKDGSPVVYSSSVALVPEEYSVV